MQLIKKKKENKKSFLWIQVKFLFFWVVKLNAFGIPSGVKVNLLNRMRIKSTDSNQ